MMQTIHGLNSTALDEAVRPAAPMTAAGRKATSTPMTKRRALWIGKHADRESPQPAEIDRQQGEDRAELDQHREEFAEILRRRSRKSVPPEADGRSRTPG